MAERSQGRPAVDPYRSLNGAQKVANGLSGNIRWEREVRLYARAQGAGAIKRTEHRCEFGNAVRDALEPQHPDATERLADIVTEPDAGPVVREAAMQEIGFEA